PVRRWLRERRDRWGPRGPGAVVQTRRARPDAVERLVGVAGRLAEMPEPPWVAGVERVLGGCEVLRIGFPASAVGADPVPALDLAEARETAGVVVIPACRVLHAVAARTIFGEELA